MLVCQKQEDFFYVYTTKDSFTEKISFNPEYMNNLAKFEHFFDNYICPELFSHSILAKVIVKSIVNDIFNMSTTYTS